MSCRAIWNCSKNCPMCSQNLTIFLRAILFLLIHLFLSPSLPCHLCPFLSASIDPLVSSHFTLEAGAFQTTFALAVDGIQFISISLLILLVLIRVTLLFHNFVFEGLRTHLRHIQWNWSCGHCRRGSICVHTSLDSTNVLCWMAHISHKHISSLPRLLQHVIPNFRKVRYCGCKSTASRISFSITCLIALAFTSSSSSAGLPR